MQRKMPFTAENAAECARKSHAPESARFKPKPVHESAQNGADLCSNGVHEDADTFREQAKLRAREHIKRLQGRIDDLLDRRELDVKAMRDLADAVLKLEQVEQRLSGRPLPGTLKPTAKPPRRSQELPSPTPSEE